MTTWATLFERAADHGVDADDVRDALAARRSDAGRDDDE